MPKWIDEICDVLYKCDTPQIQRALIKEWFDEHGELVIGKCAMGVLSCESGKILTPDLNEELIDDIDNYHEIMKLYNVPEEWWSINLLPQVIHESESDLPTMNIDMCVYDDNVGEVITGHNQLHSFIFNLNDAGLTFKEISECIRVTFEDVDD